MIIEQGERKLLFLQLPCLLKDVVMWSINKTWKSDVRLRLMPRQRCCKTTKISSSPDPMSEWRAFVYLQIFSMPIWHQRYVTQARSKSRVLFAPSAPNLLWGKLSSQIALERGLANISILLGSRVKGRLSRRTQLCEETVRWLLFLIPLNRLVRERVDWA